MDSSISMMQSTERGKLDMQCSVNLQSCKKQGGTPYNPAQKLGLGLALNQHANLRIERPVKGMLNAYITTNIFLYGQQWAQVTNWCSSTAYQGRCLFLDLLF